ncbi:GNAT family protein [Streptosporangium soli]|nr:GNAT family N-acetyltransferase [Streptosporangium sp. KLBMP 9127]
MDSDAVLATFDHQMRRGARHGGSGSRVERVGDVVRQTSPDDGWNGVLWSDLDQDTADAAIAEQVRHFASAGQAFEWKLYTHDRPADLAARLRAAGFTPEPAETLMVARIRDLATDTRPPEGITLRPVDGPAEVDLMADVHEQAFGTDRSEIRRRLLAQLSGSPDTVTAVVAMAGDLPVCAARMELYPGTDFAGLWGGGTVPAWRGRGLYRALVSFRARTAAEHGFRYLQVDASAQSRPILLRLGFVPLSGTTPYVRPLGDRRLEEGNVGAL